MFMKIEFYGGLTSEHQHYSKGGYRSHWEIYFTCYGNSVNICGDRIGRTYDTLSTMFV